MPTLQGPILFARPGANQELKPFPKSAAGSFNNLLCRNVVCSSVEGCHVQRPHLVPSFRVNFTRVNHYLHRSLNERTTRHWLHRFHVNASSDEDFRSSRNIATSLFKQYKNVIDRGGGDNIKGFVSAGVQAYALGCTEEGLRMELLDIKASGVEIEGLRSYGGGTSLSFKVRSFETICTRNTEGNDLWSYNWGNNFSASKFYKMNFDHIEAPTFSPWIWRSKCTAKIKSFFWLLANDRLNTKDMLLRKSFNLDDNGRCKICDNGSLETRDHLFWSCSFSRQCWHSINITLDDTLELSQMIIAARSNFRRPFLFEAFATSCWNIWKHRNALVFDNVTPSFSSWSYSFKRELFLLSYRMKDDLKSSLVAWLDAL